MTRLVVCMDCPNYQKGGYCTHKRKDVSALAPACEYAKTINQKFNPEDIEEPMTTLSAKEYQETPEAPIDLEIVEEMPAPETKLCICCGETKPITEFYKDKKAADGHQSYCKTCLSRKAAERARKARAEKRAQREAAKTAEQTKTDEQPKKIVVRETLTDKQMVDLLREHGWTVTCYRTITEEL